MSTRSTRNLLTRLGLGAGLWFSIALSPGCAAFAGLFTGAFTGVVDGPAQISRHYEKDTGENPEVWFYNLVAVGPAGLVGGPLFGFVKGFAADIHCCFGNGSYGDVFGGYGRQSVWRPYSGWIPKEETNILVSRQP